MMERNICYAFCRLFPSRLIDYLKHIMNSCAPPHTHKHIHTQANRYARFDSLTNEAQGRRVGSARRPVHTTNEGPLRIQYNCLVPIYVFPEMKLLFPKQNYNVASPSSYTHISVRDLYFSRIGLPILLQGNMWTDPWEYINLSQTHECGYWD
jgi:hypothetical protein